MPIDIKNTRDYLGDGLYVEFDGWQIRLYAENSFGRINEVFLDPHTLEAFERYIARLKGGSFGV